MIEREVPGFRMEGGAIIPRKGLAELRKLLDVDGDAEVRLSLDGQLAYLKRGSTEVSMRLVEGEFPDYRGVIPKQSKYQIAVKRDLLFAAIKRAAIFSSERYHGVKFALSAGTLDRLIDQSRDGRSERDARRRFQGRRILDRIQRVIRTAGPRRDPARQRLNRRARPQRRRQPRRDQNGDRQQYTYVVMPMRL